MLDSTVVFNEIMYHPSDTGAVQQEWVELYNQMAVDVDMSGWRLANAVDYQFPEGTRIVGGGYLLVAANPEEFRQTIGRVALGPLDGRISNGGETIELLNNSGRRMDQLDYRDDYPWPVVADGSGSTLAKFDPMTGTAQPEHWGSSAQVGGTPGEGNFSVFDPTVRESTPIPQLRINEMPSAGSAEFWLELKNLEDQTIDLNGYVIANLTQQTEFRLGSQMVAAGGLAQVSSADFQPESGDRIILYTPEKTSALDGQNASDLLQGRSTEHAGRWLYPSRATPGEANQFAFHDEIVVNEIQYHARPQLARPEIPATFGSVPLISFQSNWLYDQSGRDLGPNWYQTTYAEDQQDWFSGPTPIGFERGRAADLIATEIDSPRSRNPKVITHYFQKQFEFTGDPTEPDLQLQLGHLIDDAAVFYLNGVEVERFNIPAGPLASDTLATDRVNNAEGVGPVDIPANLLRNGTNVLSVELHQQASDISETDIFFDARLSIPIAEPLAPAVPSTPFIESNEEWIELYNRGQQAVDLTGWRLDNAVGYEFSAGTTIEPGEYLVVAKDATRLQGVHPSINVVGNFTRTLSNSSDDIVLLDDRGNPADAVTYFDGRNWPSYADGYGATLELRDPDADNSRSEAWGASDERDGASWQRVMYRGNASDFPGTNDPKIFSEFIFGLLGAGEILIDDISVVKNPDGNPEQLIQNGGFDTGTEHFRLLGNHGSHGFSRIATDPDDADNAVLHLVSTGSTEHMSNHVETTLAGSQLSDSETVEISFRVRWLAGSNQLHTRLYFNKLARTTILDVPEHSGTPGAPNSVRVANLGPTYTDLTHQPTIPTADDDVVVSVQAHDVDGVAAMSLWYAADGGDWQRVAMSAHLHSIYQGVIPPMPAASVVQFYVEGVDGDGATSTFPAAGPNSRALYIVDDGRDQSTLQHSFRILMTDADLAIQGEVTNVMSNHRLGATIVTDSHVYYDVGLRRKGSGYGRRGNFGYNIRFHPDQLFRGVHDVIAIDRKDNLFGGGASHSEIVHKHIGAAAGGVPSMYDDLIYLIPPDNSLRGPAQLMMARYDDDFLDGSFQNGRDGTLFELELIYHAGSTIDGEPDSLKPNPDAITWVDIADMGDNKEAYRWNFLPKNSRLRDDYAPIIELGKTLSLAGSSNGSELDLRSQQIMDVDQWLRTYAYLSLGGINDTYNQGLPHNLQLFVRPSDRRIVPMPWDQDFAFHHGPSLALLGSGSNLQKVMRIPNNLQRYYGHMHDMIQTTYNLEYLQPWIEHYSLFTRLDKNEDIEQYITARRNYVLDRLPTEGDFAVTTPADLVVDASFATLKGRGWINVREIRMNDQPLALDIVWTGQNRWQLTVPVSLGTQEVQLQAFDFQGQEIGSDSILITSTATNPLQDALRISEVHYHPADATAEEIAAGFADADDFEFIELMNVGQQTIQLADVRLIQVPVGADQEGVDFDFAASPIGELSPNERLLVVENEGAFRLRYGDGLPVAGQWTGGLGNGGETITLLAGPGVIQQFAYDDAWHRQTDGSGPSLEVINPTSPDLLSWASVEAWRPSATVNGTPGSVGTNADFNGDNQVNAADIDLLFAAIGDVAPPIEFDLTADGKVDHADVDHFVVRILRSRFGDTNLDRIVDTQDFEVLAANFGRTNQRWATGDFDGDGDVDFRDFNILTNNFMKTPSS